MDDQENSALAVAGQVAIIKAGASQSLIMDRWVVSIWRSPAVNIRQNSPGLEDAARAFTLAVEGLCMDHATVEFGGSAIAAIRRADGGRIHDDCDFNDEQRDQGMSDTIPLPDECLFCGEPGADINRGYHWRCRARDDLTGVKPDSPFVDDDEDQDEEEEE